MMKPIRTAWQLTPDDAARIALVAICMPLFFWVYHLAPGQMSARATFSISIGLLGVLVGWLIEERRKLRGFTITVMSMVTAFAACLVLVKMPDPTWAWRTFTGATQATVVIGWLMLWRCRRKWLSRSLAGWAAFASAAGFVLYVASNFFASDPLMALGASSTWGLDAARSIVARVTSWPIEPILFLAFEVAVILTLRKWTLRELRRQKRA